MKAKTFDFISGDPRRFDGTHGAKLQTTGDPAALQCKGMEAWTQEEYLPGGVEELQSPRCQNMVQGDEEGGTAVQVVK